MPPINVNFVLNRDLGEDIDPKTAQKLMAVIDERPFQLNDNLKVTSYEYSQKAKGTGRLTLQVEPSDIAKTINELLAPPPEPKVEKKTPPQEPETKKESKKEKQKIEA